MYSRYDWFRSYFRKSLSQFSSTALVLSNIWHKKVLLLTQYYKIDILIGITFLYIFLDPLLYNFMRPKLGISCLSILTMSTVQSIQIKIRFPDRSLLFKVQVPFILYMRRFSHYIIHIIYLMLSKYPNVKIVFFEIGLMVPGGHFLSY